MTTADPFADFKAKQRESWARFAPLEAVTTPTAARLVKFAGVKPGDKVLDVACGTGVVALTARGVGAKAWGLDLTPELLARAKENAGLAGFDDIAWREGDAESLPYKDGEFDVVLSQFGHMFAPRPEVATKELLRVLKPGGRVAFSTWPPDGVVGRIFGITGKHLPPPPGVAPPPQWGIPSVVQERLGSAVKDLTFDRAIMLFPALSMGHYRAGFETSSGPVLRIVQNYASDPAKLAAFRKELDDAAAPYFEDNIMRQHFLMTRAIKV